MSIKTNIGIIICSWFQNCAGGKCLRAMRDREGAFSSYAGLDLDLVGYITCDCCLGGKFEEMGEELVKNGTQVIHLATGLLIGNPPCPYIDNLAGVLEKQFNLKVVLGTHPIPQEYLDRNTQLGIWENSGWQHRLAATMSDEETRKSYD
ncbi:MAG: CGGC domain-containing protein [Anaerolineaceae bacterium]